jgi:hypothetical protein
MSFAVVLSVVEARKAEVEKHLKAVDAKRKKEIADLAEMADLAMDKRRGRKGKRITLMKKEDRIAQLIEAIKAGGGKSKAMLSRELGLTQHYLDKLLWELRDAGGVAYDTFDKVWVVVEIEKGI